MSTRAIRAAAPRGRVAWLLALLLAFALVALALLHGLEQIGHAPVSIVIDGDEIVNGLDLGALSSGHKLVLAIGLAALGLVALVVLPLALAIGITLMLAALLALVSLPLLVVVLVLTLVASPLLVVLVLLWLALRRRRRSPPPADTATMRR
jgi:hypothetical protein